MKRATTLLAVLTTTVLGFVVACEPPCAPTDATCNKTQPEAIPTYAVTITNAPASLGALVISFDGQGRSMRVALDAPLRSALREGDGSRITWRAAVVGTLTAGRIGTIVRDAPGGSKPTAVVVEAAAGAAGGYASIPATQIAISIDRIN